MVFALVGHADDGLPISQEGRFFGAAVLERSISTSTRSSHELAPRRDEATARKGSYCSSEPAVLLLKMRALDALRGPVSADGETGRRDSQPSGKPSGCANARGTTVESRCCAACCPTFVASSRPPDAGERAPATYGAQKAQRAQTTLGAAASLSLKLSAAVSNERSVFRRAPGAEPSHRELRVAPVAQDRVRGSGEAAVASRVPGRATEHHAVLIDLRREGRLTFTAGPAEGRLHGRTLTEDPGGRSTAAAGPFPEARTTSYGDLPSRDQLSW